MFLSQNLESCHEGFSSIRAAYQRVTCNADVIYDEFTQPFDFIFNVSDRSKFKSLKEDEHVGTTDHIKLW